MYPPHSCCSIKILHMRFLFKIVSILSSLSLSLYMVQLLSRWIGFQQWDLTVSHHSFQAEVTGAFLVKDLGEYQFLCSTIKLQEKTFSWMIRLFPTSNRYLRNTVVMHGGRWTSLIFYQTSTSLKLINGSKGLIPWMFGLTLVCHIFF